MLLRFKWLFEKLHGSKWSCKTMENNENSGSCHDCRVLWAIKPHQDPLGNLKVGWDCLSEEVVCGLNPSLNLWESALRPFVFVNVLCMCALVHFCQIWMEVIEAGHRAHCPFLIPWHLQRINVRGGDTAGSYYCLRAFMRGYGWRPTVVDLQMD